MKQIRLVLLSALLSCLVSSVWAAEVSDSLKFSYSLGSSSTFTFNYPSKNIAGEDIVLSSSLVVWTPDNPQETDSIEALHIYSHFTITSDHECPTSDYNLKERALFTLLIRNKYGSGLDPDLNYLGHAILIAPDFEGYGVSRDVPHPYLSQELTARQMVDAVEYGLKLYQKHVNDKRTLPIKTDWRTYGFGFSQGGAVALAVQRYLEEQAMDEQLHYRGTICGDGPYDLVATLLYYINDDGNSYGQQTEHRKGMNTMPMVVPMIIKGMLDTHPDMKNHALTDYLSQQFLDTGIMDWLESKMYVINDIHEMWYEQLQEGLEANGRTYTPEQMAELFYSPREDRVWARLDKLFTPGFYDYLLNVDVTAPIPEGGNPFVDFHRALSDNSLCKGWEPKHRIQFVHSRGDMVVPFANYLSFRDAHPGGEGSLYRIDDSITTDHIDTGVTFYIFLTGTGTYGKFFQWFDEADPTDIADIEQSRQTPERYDGAVYDLSGRKVNSKLPKGIYIRNGKKVAIK